MVTVARDWDESHVPDQRGRRVLITGATNGLGNVTARALRARGADVSVAVRDLARGNDMVSRGEAPSAHELDLASLASVRRFADTVDEPFDVVVCNAGVMWVPFALTVDGVETHMATNHLGHFALVGLLAERIRERVVVVSSFRHRMGTLGDGSSDAIERRCRGEGEYSPDAAYDDSKLANLLFMRELERRRRAGGLGFFTVAAHPGWSATNLFAHSRNGVAATFARLTSPLFAQPASKGAWPQIFAATSPDLHGGEYVGPAGFKELRGRPTLVGMSALAKDDQVAQNLWRVSERLTGVSFGEVPAP